MVLLGWSRAILLQMAHPLIAAGVVDHSHFRAGARVAVARLRGTIRSMLALGFGDPTEAARSIAAIRAIHVRVNGALRTETGVFPAGTRYSAEDPALVLWVHATYLESVLMTYERLVGPVNATDRDAYCEEAAPTALALGADPEAVPRSWAALEQYLAAEYASGRITVGPDARLIADAVLFPPLSLVTGPFAWVNRVVTLGLLPAPVRDQYRYSWNARRDGQLNRTLAALRRVRSVTPRSLALWPKARVTFSSSR